MKFNFRFKGKSFCIDVKKCESFFSKAMGLMFKGKSRPLLFIFNKSTRQAIHSFFCRPFLAVWFDNEEIVDVKMIKPWRCFIYPKSKFNKLLEIPSDYKHFSEFIDGIERFKKKRGLYLIL